MALTKIKVLSLVICITSMPFMQCGSEKKLTGWAAEGNFVDHLDSDTFAEYIKNNAAVLIMFYAPWCGHCKDMKPAFAEAANIFNHEKKLPGAIAAVDCTVSTAICGQYKIEGYPTVLYFKNGEKEADYNGERETDDIVNYMKNGPQPEEEKPVEKKWADEGNFVDHLDSGTFAEYIKNNAAVMIMFYAPWCGHCNSMKPAFADAAKIFNNEKKFPGAIAAVDCTVSTDICGKYKIEGYPTLLYFKNGKKGAHYNGERETEDIVNYMKNGPQPEEEKSIEKKWADGGNFVDHLVSGTFAEYIKNNAAVMIMFYAPWCGHCKSMKLAFADAAKIFNNEKKFPGAIAAVDCTVSTDICGKYKIEGYPTLLYFKNGEKEVEYNGERETEDIVNYMKNGPQPEEEKPAGKNWGDEGTDVIFLGVDTFDDFVKKEKCVFVMFYTSWCGHCKDTKPEFAEAATIINVENKVPGCKLAAVDCEKSTKVCKDKMVTGYPTLKYFKDGKDDIKYKGARSAQAIVQFLKNPADDVEKPQEGWGDEANDVVHLTSENFEENTKDKDVFIMFYAPWCGHCKTMKPDFMKLATKLKEEESSIVVAAVEATTNTDLAKREKVQGYPTLKYYKNGKSVADFEEMRSLESMYSFVQKQFTGKDDGPERWETIPSSVVHLKKETFQDYLKQNKHALVTFHVPWCQFCREIRPDMMKLASKLSEHKGIFGIAAFTCDEDKEFCTEQGIKYFPTTKYFMNGEFVTEYSDDVDDMVEFFMKKEPQLKKQKGKKDEL